jgi:tryptophanase
LEPYRIQVVEPIPLVTPEEREVALTGAHDNLLDHPADQVRIDPLSDSGTGALSAAPLAATMTGDESRAGARSIHRFRAGVEELTSYEHILPVRQSRAAERILFTALLEPRQITLGNTHFDTTRTNVELAGGQARDISCREAHDVDSLTPLKGDIDLEALEQILDGPDRDPVAVLMVTITNNGDGQPVSTGNLAGASRICQERRVSLFLDAARFAKYVLLVTQREPEFRDWSPKEVAEPAFRLANLGRAAGVAIVEPPGIHAIYLNAGRLLPRLPAPRFPGHALGFELYLEGGIRSAELGSHYVGEDDGDPLVAAPYDLVRLAIPRRVHTQTYIEYVGRILAHVAKSAERIPSHHIVESPAVPRHFRAKLEPVPIPRGGSWTGI